MMDFYIVVADGKALTVANKEQRESLSYLEGLKGIEFIPVSITPPDIPGFLVRGEGRPGKGALFSALQDMGLA